MGIRVRIVKQWRTGKHTNTREVYELATDAAYNPDAAEDLVRRVIAGIAQDTEQWNRIHGQQGGES